MEKQIEIEEDWTPDKFRDQLCDDAWKESGAKTLDEFIKWHSAKLRQFDEDVKKSGLSYGEFVLAEKIAQEKAQIRA